MGTQTQHIDNGDEAWHNLGYTRNEEHYLGESHSEALNPWIPWPEICSGNLPRGSKPDNRPSGLHSEDLNPGNSFQGSVPRAPDLESHSGLLDKTWVKM